jgi:hypothetical protein
MSNVTDVFVLIGDSRDGLAEEVAPKVAEAIAEFVDGINADTPIISINRDDWGSLQGGRKGAGGAAIWFGWNYGHPAELVSHLEAAGFTHITVWSQRETDGCDGVPPTVVSW